MTHNHITTVHFRVRLVYWSEGTFHNLFSLRLALARFWFGSLSESIVESSVYVLQMTHTTSSGGVTSLGFDRPVELTHLSWFLVLNMEVWTTSSAAYCVRLVMTLSKAGCTLSHFDLWRPCQNQTRETEKSCWSWFLTNSEHAHSTVERFI